jgi:serine/threonine protein kinase
MRNMTDMKHLSREILRLLSFFRSVRESIRFMKKSLHQKKSQLANPGRHHSELLKIAPSANSSASSPNKTLYTPKSNEKTKNKKASTKAGPSKLAKTKKIQKHRSSQEVEILCLLAPCKNVVDLYGWDLSEPERPLLVEEELFLDLPFVEVEAIFPVACRFLMDGMQAIAALRKFGVIHRDLSMHNILYSTVDACWKFIDFDLAVFADEHGEYENRNPNGPSGTKGYIAPELYSTGSRFSWKTDLYGLGTAFLNRFVEPCYLEGAIDAYQPLADSSEAYEIHVCETGLALFNELENLCHASICCKDPEKRKEPSLTNEALLDIYEKIFVLYHRESEFQECSWDFHVRARLLGY